MATYLVVLMQFKLTLVRQSAKKALIAALQKNFTGNMQYEAQSDWNDFTIQEINN